jgi:hypothetical protein
MQFVQTIEFRTHRLDELNALLDAWTQQAGDQATMPMRAWQCKDRDADDVYMHIVEFSSYEDAMRNSADPRTDAMFKKLVELCDAPPTFRNLDLVSEHMPSRTHAHT